MTEEQAKSLIWLTSCTVADAVATMTGSGDFHKAMETAHDTMRVLRLSGFKNEERVREWVIVEVTARLNELK